MTIADTTTPTRSRRPARSRKAPTRWRHRRRLIIPRGRLRSVPLADIALHLLMDCGDIYKVGRTHYLVAPLDADLLETLIIAAGSTEDDEKDDEDLGADDEGEPSLGQTGADLEGDGLEDLYQGEMALISDTLDQSRQSGESDEAESSLGWANTGPQLNLAAGYSWGMVREGGDDEDGSNPPLDAADVDAQRGRIASRWPRPADDGWGLGREKASGNIARFVPASGKGGAA
jgi:hypothetical protein